MNQVERRRLGPRYTDLTAFRYGGRSPRPMRRGANVRFETVDNVNRDAAVLMVRAVTDPAAGLDLSLAQNQALLLRVASGLGMNHSLRSCTTYLPKRVSMRVLLSTIGSRGDVQPLSYINISATFYYLCS